MLVIEGIDEVPASASLTRGVVVSQDRATTAFNRVLTIPDGYYEFTEPVSGVSFGFWEPINESTRELGPDAYLFTVNWARNQNLDMVAELLTDRDHMLEQMDLLVQRPSEPGYNDLYVWNVILHSLPGNWEDGPASFEFLEVAGQGLWLADLILSDMPREDADLNAILAVLAEYQLVLAPDADTFAQLRFLLDHTGVIDLPRLTSWQSRNDRSVKERQTIICEYLLPTGMTSSIRSGETVDVLRVKEPANTIQEARLEILLQREAILANKWRASASMLLDASWGPLTTVVRDNRYWRVLSVSHRWPAGTAADTTELQLRGLASDRNPQDALPVADFAAEIDEFLYD